MAFRRLIFKSLRLLILIQAMQLSAHSGRTDSNGGHNDNISGGYHYHHGKAAHYHTNGECDLITQQSSSTVWDFNSVFSLGIFVLVLASGAKALYRFFQEES
jgi:hypothetical protein